MGEFIQLKLQDGIGQVVLNRPDSYNALNLATTRQRADALHGLIIRRSIPLFSA